MKKYILLLLLVLSLSVMVFSGCSKNNTDNPLPPVETIQTPEIIDNPTTELPNKAKLGIEVPEDTLLVGFGFNSSSPNVSYLVMSKSGDVTIYSCDLDTSDGNTLGTEIKSFTLSKDKISSILNISTKVAKFVDVEEKELEGDGLVTVTFAGMKFYLYNSEFPEGICIDYTGEFSEQLFETINDIYYENESLTSLTMLGVE